MTNEQPWRLPGSRAARGAALAFVILVTSFELCVAGIAAPLPPATNSLTPPTFAHLSSNVLARSKWERTQNTTAQFAFSKARDMIEFDGDGKVTQRKQSRQEWFPINGIPFARLAEKDGKPLTDKERKAEAEREAAVRAGKSTLRSPEVSKREKQWQFTDEMMARYTFKITGQELVRGRPAWVVEFEPKDKNLQPKTIPERVANKVAGKLWVDTEDWELARMKFWLTGEVNLIGGMVGVLKTFQLTLERTRIEADAWLPTMVDFEMSGRELLANKRLRYREDATSFKRVAPATTPVSNAPAAEPAAPGKK